MSEYYKVTGVGMLYKNSTELFKFTKSFTDGRHETTTSYNK
jgi:hypothetical protein